MYEELINDEFTKIGAKPKHNQVDIIDGILKSFLNEGHTNVVLNAPPGVGKSHIGFIVNKCLSTLENIDIKQTFILVHNNSLIKQYRNSFDDINYITGAGTYRCSVTGDTADNCIMGHLFKKINKSDQDKSNISFCKHQCKYKKSRQHANDNNVLLTNYSYFIINRLNSEFLEPRNLTIYDEVHTLNNVFVNHMSIDVNIDMLTNMLNDNDTIDINIKSNINDLIYGINDVTKSNYNDYLDKLNVCYTKIINKIIILLKDDDNDVELFKLYNKIFTKYSGLSKRIKEFNDNKYEHSIQIENDMFSIKPIFIGDMINKIIHSKYNLFMSATIEKTVFEKTIHLDNVKYINVKPVFEPSSKQIMFFNIGSINFKFLKQDKNKNIIVKYVKDIIKSHPDENGMIHTPNFVINKYIGERLKRVEKTLNIKVFVHKQGEKFDDLFKRYKRYNDGSKVMLSPSAYEGIDLKDDLARFQIIIKAPYPSIADSRISYILENHNELYKLMTLYKVIQGMGRSTRSTEDHSIVYCLDSNLERLFNDRDNIWKDEFEVLG